MSMLEYCIIPDWPAPKQVRSLQTTRLGGGSVAPYDSLNLGSHVGDAPLAVARNRMLLNTILPSEPVWLEQVHGTVVANADGPGGGCDTLPEKPADCGSSHAATPHATENSSVPLVSGCRPQADACVAKHRAAVCVVMTADCLPILLCDQQGSVVGAAHAGWKGLAAGVIEATVQAMNVAPKNLMAWLGPAIGQNSFEVGDDVRDIFLKADPQATAAFRSGDAGKWFADMFLLARMHLNALGVNRVYGGNCCTYQDSKRYFSYRRDGVTGRMGTFIWIE